MRRVEIVNLGGRAHHVESDGVAAIDAWLDIARMRLNGDPDRDDLLLDFERAIGEKCDARVATGSDVVTNEDISSILESLGTIEPSGDGTADFDTTPPHVEERARRLYRLPDERMIAGVCSGVAAWMRVDVTVVRVGWVVLTVLLSFGSNGVAIPFSIALYALLAFVLPRADSPETRAAAHGHGNTAQDRLLQARSGASPALTSVGSRLSTGIHIAARATRVFLLIVITAVLAIWVVGAIWLAVAGDPVVNVFGDGVSSWLVPLFLTCVAVLLVAPPAALAAVLDYATRVRSGGDQRRHLTIWLVAATAAWVAALTVAVVVAASIPGVRDVWPDGNGRIFFHDRTYCFVSGASEAHCQPGDEIIVDGNSRRDSEFPALRGTPTGPAMPPGPMLPRPR